MKGLKGVINPGEGMGIFNGNRVKFAVINAKSEGTVLLPY